MIEQIAEGAMVFLADGAEAVGAVREVNENHITVFVENAGDFEVPRAAIASVHSGKVLLKASALSHTFLRAIRHAHDSEDPKLTG